MNECAKKVETHCPIQNSLGDSEQITKWIDNVNNTKEEVTKISTHLDRKPKTSVGTWLSVGLAACIFLFGGIYTVGVQSNNISNNEENILINTAKIELVDTSIHDVKEAIVELRIMAADIREIKLYLLEQISTKE